jgi:flavin-dependent dehydrogenase
VQLLASEGISLPDSVIQRGIDSYVLHMDEGIVRIDTPLREKRIASVYRGNGPQDSDAVQRVSFDKYLLGLAESQGARVIRKLVNDVSISGGRPKLKFPYGNSADYDLVVLAVGINSNLLKVLENSPEEYELPEATKTFICEFCFSKREIERIFGNSMHVFLLDIPRLEFAALIPKGDYVTLCMLGDGIDRELVASFLKNPEVRRCFPDGRIPEKSCFCLPRINVKGASKPFTDRVVFIGDSGVTRLYKDGIGAAYRTAKAAATTALFHGVSDHAFRKNYWPVCRAIKRDNTFGKLMFMFSKVLQMNRISKRAILQMTSFEQEDPRRNKPMSSVLWDLFTGSASYGEIMLRTFNPVFILRLLLNHALAFRPAAKGKQVAPRLS